MDTLDLQPSLQTLSNKGYCLWVGNGVSTYLAQMSGVTMPSWGALLSQIENDYGLRSDNNWAYPKRFELIQEKITAFEFQRALRKNIVDKLSDSILQYVKHQILSGEISAPIEVVNLATLGCLANPIVNFNIECISSSALAGWDQSYAIKAYHQKLPNRKRIYSSSGTISRERFHRNIYHPHGSLEHYGLCVMTEKEYESLTETLGFQLAIHSAFEEFLVIVGMSLHDRYLREQIAENREYVKGVYWYSSDADSFDNETIKWVEENEITIIPVEWSSFWKELKNILPAPTEFQQLFCWEQVLYAMKNSFEGKQSHEDHISWLEKGDVDTTHLKLIGFEKGFSDPSTPKILDSNIDKYISRISFKTTELS